MSASVNGRVIRVDFSTWAALPRWAARRRHDDLRVGARRRTRPGQYRVEAWARPTTGGASEKYFTRDFVTAPQAYVVEYYHEALDHYFITAAPDEIALLDGGGQGGWKAHRAAFPGLGEQLRRAPGSVPVCRFYAKGPNSHFYTGDARECQQLKQHERGRARDRVRTGQAVPQLVL
jgi:hypothetical protein